MEIERKYLLKYLPDGLDGYPRHEIEQGYLCTTPTVRIRKSDDHYILTVKEHRASQTQSPLQPIVNREEEFDLTAESYALLRAKCEGLIISKTRYVIDLRRMMRDGLYVGLKAELDVFHGTHQGLFLVEVEFPDEASANSFLPPDWFGKEVSNDPHFRNSFLSQSTHH